MSAQICCARIKYVFNKLSWAWHTPSYINIWQIQYLQILYSAEQTQGQGKVECISSIRRANSPPKYLTSLNDTNSSVRHLLDTLYHCCIFRDRWVLLLFCHFSVSFHNIQTSSISPDIVYKYIKHHYTYIIMSAVASQITCVSVVGTTGCSGADQRTHQSSASLAFVRGIHGWPVNSAHKGPITRKMFPFDDVITPPAENCSIE